MSGNYSYEITIPANTARSSPLREELVLSPGLIDLIQISFPPGCAALAHVQILEQESKLFPVSPNGSYAWDGYILSFNPQYYLRTQKPVLLAQCWNEDEFYEHTVTLMINIIGVKEDDISLLGLFRMLLRQ